MAEFHVATMAGVKFGDRSVFITKWKFPPPKKILKNPWKSYPVSYYTLVFTYATALSNFFYGNFWLGLFSFPLSFHIEGKYWNLFPALKGILIF